MILGLLKLQMNSKVPPTDMSPPDSFYIKHIMIFSSMLVLGIICKRRNVYNTNIDSNYVDYPTDVIDYVPTHFMEVLIFLLMSSIRSMPFCLGIHLLQGLVIPPYHLSDLNLNNQGPKSHLKSMMAYLPSTSNL